VATSGEWKLEDLIFPVVLILVGIYLISRGPGSWRWTMGFGAIISVIIYMATFFKDYTGVTW